MVLQLSKATLHPTPRVAHNFLSSWKEIIDRRSQSLQGGLGAPPPENFYILIKSPEMEFR